MRIKELAQEARFIKHEEKRIQKHHKITPGHWDYNTYKYVGPDDKTVEFFKLRSHRIFEVRRAARSAQLAYGFLRGMPYSEIEPKRKQEKEFQFDFSIKKEIKRLVAKFGKPEYADEVERWLNE